MALNEESAELLLVDVMRPLIADAMPGGDLYQLAPGGDTAGPGTPVNRTGLVFLRRVNAVKPDALAGDLQRIPIHEAAGPKISAKAREGPISVMSIARVRSTLMPSRQPSPLP